MNVTLPKDMKAMRRHARAAATLLKSLAHEARLAVLCELVDGERSAGALVETAGLGQSALSQHLARLRLEGIVKTRREGQTIYYSLANDKVAQVVATLHELYCRKD